MNHFKKKQLKVLTWHVHGNYLYYLTQANCLFYLPVTSPTKPGYYGKTKSFPWGENVKEIPAEDIKNIDIDCIIFQSNFNPANPTHDYLAEQMEILSFYQRTHVPKLFIEHDPPRRHPTDTRHPLYDSTITLVHVTAFNQLMWDSGTTATTVIEHGVMTPSTTTYTGEINKGIVVINNIHKRGRRLGLDIYEKVKNEIPLDLIGMGSEEIGGLGEITPLELPSVIAKYRFFFHPARYTSLGLSVLEAMLTGLPIVGLATTELPTIITNGKNGYIHTDIDYLIGKMKTLLLDKNMAMRLGKEAKKTAAERFSITRFAADWEQLIEDTVLDTKLLTNIKKMRGVQTITL